MSRHCCGLSKSLEVSITHGATALRHAVDNAVGFEKEDGDGFEKGDGDGGCVHSPD